MKLETTAALPNSVVLLMDHKSGEPPESMGGRLIAVSESCLAIGTMAEQSGQTRFIMADALSEVDQPDMRVAFDGQIRATSGEISLINTLNERLLTLPVSSDEVRVRVLVNDDNEPDCVAVVLG